MPSVVGICNIALSRLGDAATVASIDPPEGSAQAEHCSLFYPAARDALLEQHPWGFATRRSRLPRIADMPIGGQWRFAYALPNEFIRAIDVFAEGAERDPADYSIEGGSVLANIERACMRYVFRQDDTARYPPLFTDALAWLLASYLAGPVLKNQEGAAESKRCLQFYQASLSLAARSDAGQRKMPDDYVPAAIRARQ